MKKIGDQWTDSQIAPFCDGYKDLYPVLTRDGNTLFFTSNRPVESGGKLLTRGWGHIWKVERTSSGWSEPEHIQYN